VLISQGMYPSLCSLGLARWTPAWLRGRLDRETRRLARLVRVCVCQYVCMCVFECAFVCVSVVCCLLSVCLWVCLWCLCLCLRLCLLSCAGVSACMCGHARASLKRSNVMWDTLTSFVVSATGSQKDGTCRIWWRKRWRRKWWVWWGECCTAKN